MTEKITSVSSMPKKVKKTTSRSEVEQAAVRELVKAARARGEDLTGPDGLLKSITATESPRSESPRHVRRLQLLGRLESWQVLVRRGIPRSSRSARCGW